MDRIDLHIEVEAVPFEDLSKKELGESSASIGERVTAARRIQGKRFNQLKGTHYNAQMTPKQLRKFCALNPESLQLLKTAMDKLGLSARAYDRILKMSRTIADLDQSEIILPSHIAEAIQYRSLDREGFI